MKTYSELMKLESFEDRLRYCQTDSVVGFETFGGRRMLNQTLYQSPEWKKTRQRIIARDLGQDLCHPDRPIVGPIYVHHLNEITPEDILNRDPKIFDPENLICTSFDTHQRIHYCNVDDAPQVALERSANDTCPWK